MMLEVAQWFTTISAIVGAILISVRRPVAGYMIMIPGGLSGLYYCLQTGQEGFLFREAAFFVINIVGLVSWYNFRGEAASEKAP